METIEKFLAAGNFDLLFREIDDKNKYTAEPFGFKGLIEFNVDYKQEANIVAADDDPLAFATLGPITGSGELKVTGFRVGEMEKLFNIKINDNGGVSLGDYNRSLRFFGMALKSRGSDDSIDYYCLQKVVFDFPNLKTATITVDGKEVNECTIPFNCYPYFYMDQAGHEARTTANYFNSVVNKDIWAGLAETVYDPAHDYSASTPTPPAA